MTIGSHAGLAVPLSDVEVAAGMPLGFDSVAVDAAVHVSSPREALENAVRAALHRAPCLVSFSGGRDSSAMLALATEVARREGLPLPVPATLEFSDSPESYEATGRRS